MAWKISLRKDVIKGHYLESYKAWVYHEFYYLVATTGKKAYIHQKVFQNDFEGAKSFARLVRKENKHPYAEPEVWSRMRDMRAIRAEGRDWQELLKKSL